MRVTASEPEGSGAVFLGVPSGTSMNQQVVCLRPVTGRELRDTRSKKGRGTLW